MTESGALRHVKVTSGTPKVVDRLLVATGDQVDADQVLVVVGAG